MVSFPKVNRKMLNYVLKNRFLVTIGTPMTRSNMHTFHEDISIDHFIISCNNIINAIQNIFPIILDIFIINMVSLVTFFAIIRLAYCYINSGKLYRILPICIANIT